MKASAVKTYTHAIKMNWLSIFPGLSVDAVQKHLPKSDQTPMGHRHQIRKNIGSTTKITPEMIMNKMDNEPLLEPPQKINNQEHYVEINIVNFKNLNGMISTDQTRKFPITSGRRNTHIMVLYDHNSNFINATAIKSRIENDLINGYKKLFKELYI